ncbi:MAG: hypothetical protein PHW40_04635, partial [Candidatus Izemoplasmatales bacterium]|nr:hypothetical protein [Candidatus Izemoplasmatales bacterium]
MKKFFGSLVILLSLLLVSLVVIPWNNLSLFWNLNVPFLSDNELYIKGGIGGLLLIFGIIFLLVSNHEHRVYGHVKPQTAAASFAPMFMYMVGALGYGLIITLFIYNANQTQTNLLFLIGLGFVLLNIIVFGHMLSSAFRRQKNFGRLMLFILTLELMLVAMGAAYIVRTIMISDADYASLYTFYYIGAPGVAIVLYIIHLIVLKVKSKHHSEEAELEREIDDIRITKKDSAP